MHSIDLKKKQCDKLATSPTTVENSMFHAMAIEIFSKGGLPNSPFGKWISKFVFGIQSCERNMQGPQTPRPCGVATLYTTSILGISKCK